jgi:hypothetical protein
MRQTVVGVFTHQVSAEMTLRRLEMRGFDAESVSGPSTESPARCDDVERPSGACGTWRRIQARCLSLGKAAMSLLSFSQAPRQGEVHVKVRANSVLEAQAAREILHASGARQSGCLGEGWTNWNW